MERGDQGWLFAGRSSCWAVDGTWSCCRGVAADRGLVIGARAVLVSPAAGTALAAPHIYWANETANTIGEANLDGTGVNQSFITGANLPFGVAVDGQHIYWANDGSNTIGEANLDGTGVSQSLITGANAPVGVAVDGQHIYWANYGASGRRTSTAPTSTRALSPASPGCSEWRSTASTSTGPA
jgi:hypothetical protein